MMAAMLKGQQAANATDTRPRQDGREVEVKASATTRTIACALSNWCALTRFLDDGHVPIGNNAAENAIRPLAIEVGDHDRYASAGSLHESWLHAA